MTSVSGFISRIEQDEVDAREETLKLFYALREIGERRLLTRSLNWQRFLYVEHDAGNESHEDPKSALASSSRIANRKRWARQKARRSGARGLAEAIG